MGPFPPRWQVAQAAMAAVELAYILVSASPLVLTRSRPVARRITKCRRKRRSSPLATSCARLLEARAQRFCAVHNKNKSCAHYPNATTARQPQGQPDAVITKTMTPRACWACTRQAPLPQFRRPRSRPFSTKKKRTGEGPQHSVRSALIITICKLKRSTSTNDIWDP